jgi:ribosome-binding protein aMBF1 (putative translation factor)
MKKTTARKAASKSKKSAKSITAKTTTGSLTLDREPSELLSRVLQGKSIPKRLRKGLEESRTVEMSLKKFEATLEREVQAERVGELLKQARETQGVTLRELARRMKVKHPTIVNFEKASSVELSTVARVAEALGYDVWLELAPKQGGEMLSAKVG